MEKEFDIQEYMTRGVERVVTDAIRATIKNPKESAFMARFMMASKVASAKRKKMEEKGEHVPPFLIASITSNCNLHCAGCYSRCNNSTKDSKPVNQLSDEEWQRIFNEADELGISFILLAGGEPLLRAGVIDAAGKKTSILFPIFTNGTFMNEKYLKKFDKCRNLLPIMSIEGGREKTDNRRGAGVYEKIVSNMDELKKKDIIFGVSVTVTKENIKEVSSKNFIGMLSDKGCKAVIFVEYVPVSSDSEELALTDDERDNLNTEIFCLRKEHEEMVFVSFPGDEKSSGGCIAAGRGFFHINSHGDAEPCPFSPYSDINVKETSLKEALKSRLFHELQNEKVLLDEHKGGCVLYEKRHQVEKYSQIAEGEKYFHSIPTSK
ncbi:Radical SAM superfamily enzyme, MoaA/NifB/PqqE/SkfB family [Acetitomaculum ruminis DSM 5522]|uniref:Radical SAM superfamily enzyme, MoaA/NifB/PqqE/SkfB family n=1 Tax=Acetitomaculum ruminis DSM 5522 TaxID=1120918 RepID=A0A1I0Y3K1_9FIRM|nr:radical SAM protein [Acetitomaculum ruminis]SFB07881.1 Radical SAM superfamily enzyme, MoaA/NifB/PqqE/SkfB family [Acetitomaculum ruminis DSM 5522]